MLDAGEAKLITLVDLGQEVPIHEIHVLDHLKRYLGAFDLQVLLRAHFPRNREHELDEIEQILEALAILILSIVDEGEGLLKFSFQSDNEGFHQFVDE